MIRDWRICLLFWLGQPRPKISGSRQNKSPIYLFALDQAGREKSVKGRPGWLKCSDGVHFNMSTIMSPPQTTPPLACLQAGRTFRPRLKQQHTRHRSVTADTHPHTLRKICLVLFKYFKDILFYFFVFYIQKFLYQKLQQIFEKF